MKSVPVPDREAEQLGNVPLPEINPTLIGHEAVRTSLREGLENNSLPNAILLTGPRGIGKATLAFAITRDILAATSGEDVARVGLQVASGSHPNLHVLRRKPKDKGFESVIRVVDIRAMRDRMMMTRGTNGARICVIDSIDDCNAQSANALLKILEEPPADTHFILVSHRPAGLLPTIRSRCHVHAMRLLDAEQMGQVSAQLFSGVETELREGALRNADGRPRQLAEILGFGDMAWLQTFQTWLDNPVRTNAADTLRLADAITAASEPERKLAVRRIFDYLRDECGAIANAPAGDRLRLASLTRLWDKAQTMFVDAEIYNLDFRQTLLTIFDSIKADAAINQETTNV